MGSHEGHVDVAGLADGLAVVDGLQHRQLAGTLLDDARDPEQVLPAVAPGQLRPHPGVGTTGGPDGPVDVLGSGGGDLGEDLLGGRVDGLERRAVGRVDELAVDEQPVGAGDVDDGPRLRGGCVLERGHGPQSNVK